MQIVIDIPKDIYAEIMAHNREMREGGKSAYYFEGLIQNGILLPKGHGKLIDADALDKSLEKEQEDLDLNDELSNAFDDGLTWASEVLSKEPTIIEADKTEGEV